MKRDLGDLNAPEGQLVQKVVGEVKASGRGRHRPRLPGINGLIPFPVQRLVLPVDIGRKRHVAESLDGILGGQVGD